MVIKSQSVVQALYSVHLHSSPFTRPSFSIFRGSGFETRAGLGLITFLKTFIHLKHLVYSLHHSNVASLLP